MADLADLEAVMARWEHGVEQRRADICAALCADDALFLSSDAPTAIGLGAVTEVIESWVAAGSAGERSWTIASFLDGDRPMLARGYELDLVTGASVETERGRYLVTFRRVGERWMIEALAIFASDLD